MKLEMNKLFPVLKGAAISLILFSCSETVREETLFPEEKAIVFSEMSVGDSLGRVLTVKSMKDYLVLTEVNAGTQLQLIDKKPKKTYRFGRTGQGPGELLAATDFILKDDKRIEVYDAQQRTLFDFNIDSVLKWHEYARPEVLIREIPMFPLSIGALDGQTYVAPGLGLGMKRFMLMDSRGEVVSTAGELPEKKMAQVSDFVHAYAYWARVTTNRKESKVAICTNYAGIMQIYDCKTGAVRLIREHRLFPADYGEADGNLVASAQTRWGYISVDSSDEYIFALYSGLNQADNPDGAYAVSGVIHVFDWDGNPVCRLTSDRKLQTICVDGDSRLYGYDTEKEDIAVADTRHLFAPEP
jgi:hypothetical protein